MHFCHRLVLALLAAVLAPGCTRRGGRAGPVPPDKVFRPIAEYEPVTGVFFGTGIERTMGQPSFGLRGEDTAYNAARAEEYEEFFTAVMRAQPQLRYFIHTDALPYEGTEASEWQAWQTTAAGWEQQGLSVDMFALDAEDYPPGVNEERLHEDEWTRDYGPVGYYWHGEKQFVSFRQRGALTNAYLAASYKRALSPSRLDLEGGNFMATANGTCAVARLPDETAVDWEHNYTPRLKRAVGCRQVLTFAPLPYEGTHHIDLFAKFVADDTVAVASYASDDIKVEPRLSQVSYHCTAVQIAARDWYNCEPGDETVVDEPVWAGASGGVGGDTLRSPADLTAFVAANFPGADSVEDVASGSLQAHSRMVAQEFAAAGFKTVLLPAPRPSVHFGLVTYENDAGQAVYEEWSAEFTHPSYANSLLVNGHAFVPAYAGDEAANEKALQVYRELGFTAHAVTMTETSKAGGAVHCLSKELH